MCDDLVMAVAGGHVEAAENACHRARAFYSGLSEHLDDGVMEAMVGGQKATREGATARAAEILGKAKRPLVAGLDSDVAGMRAALRLAEHCGGVIDPLHGDALFRNLRVMQTEGSLATTLGEARNRADLLVIFGVRPVTEYPRLLERLTSPGDTLFESARDRRLYLVGPHHDPLPGSLDSCNPIVLRVEPEDLGEFAGLLRGRSSNQRPPLACPERLNPHALETLALRLRDASYPVLIWAAGEFDFGHGDLTVQRFQELARGLSEHNRCTSLPLSQGSAAITANQVSTWCCGFPPRVSFAEGAPSYDPQRYASRRMLARGEADALLWVASIDSETPPPEHPIPRIVLGQRPPPPHNDDVFVRVAVPGVDHPGQMFRSDGLPLTLRKLRDTSWPAVATVLEAIRERCP